MSFVYLEEREALQLSSELRHTSTPAMKHRRFARQLHWPWWPRTRSEF